MRASSAFAILVALLFATADHSRAQTATVNANWSTAPVVRLTLTPNYATGYGSVAATFGTQSTPVAGPGACFQGCAVDFGSVMSGSDYLYKYAAHLKVTTNDANGFTLYGEGAADFTNTADNSTTVLNQTLYYLPSVASGDTNTGFSASLPFYRTSAMVSGNSFSTAPTITYGTYPAPMANTSTSSSDLYYDYQLKVPGTATAGQYYVWIVYTVVAK